MPTAARCSARSSAWPKTACCRTAARLLLGAVDDLEPVELARITMPTLVLLGDNDRDNGSPQKLVDALPNARLREMPGTHMSSVTEPALGEALVEFLKA